MGKTQPLFLDKPEAAARLFIILDCDALCNDLELFHNDADFSLIRECSKLKVFPLERRQNRNYLFWHETVDVVIAGADNAPTIPVVCGEIKETIGTVYNISQPA